MVIVSGIASAAANLNVKSIDAPSSIGTEEKMNVTVNVKNEGNETAYFDYNWGSGTPTTIFVSSNTSWDGSNVFGGPDIYVGTAYHDNTNPPLAPGESYSQVMEITCPGTPWAPVPEGNYYLMACLDYCSVKADGNHWNEGGEHGFFYQPIYIKNPDLTVSNINAPNSASTQEQISVNFTVTNQGSSVAGPGESGERFWYDGLYWSSDNILDDTDTLLGENYISNSPLPVGGTYNNLMTFNVPNVPTGNYYIIANPNSHYGEFHWVPYYIYESNLNPSYKPITVTSPVVTGIDPVNGAVNVDNSKVVTITFSTPIQAGNMWIELKNSSGTVIPITKSITDKVLTIIPTGSLAESIYTILIHTGAVTDLAGNPVVPTSSKFSVGTSPIIISTDPANNAVNIAPDNVIKITFNEPIKAGNLWIELYNSSGVQVPITKSISGSVLTISHAALLAPGTKYTMALHTGSVTDLVGNSLAGVARYFTTSTDAVAPTLKSIDPLSNAVNVARDKVITVTFSESIKAGNLWIELYNTVGTKTLIPITTSISGNVLTINHAALLTLGTKYTMALHTGSVTDLAGNSLAGVVRYFTTIDDTAPTVKSIDPVNNAVNVARNKVITVTFSEPIKAGNLWIELYSSSGVQVPITKSISGSVLTISHAALLAPGTKYTLALHTGSVTDLVGNSLVGVARVFTTGTT